MTDLRHCLDPIDLIHQLQSCSEVPETEN